MARSLSLAGKPSSSTAPMSNGIVNPVVPRGRKGMRTLLAFALVLCAAFTAHAETQTFLTYDFEFENGSVLPELRVAYETYGNLDPGRVDAIGGGESSSPKDGLGQDFPRYTIRDMMAAQHALVTRGLELSTLRAVGG